MNIKYKSALASVGVLVSLLVAAGAASAATISANITSNWHGAGASGMTRGAGMVRPAVVGTVSAINGDTLTVTSHGFGGMMGKPNTTASAPATTMYSVDATNAVVYKNNATSSVSAIASGDNVFVQGTVSGTNVTATVIRDGVMAPGGKGGMHGNASSTKPMTPPISFTGNGQPVVAGSITSVSGNSIVITNKSNVTYTIDATSANVQKQGVGTSTVSALTVGDSVLVQGTVNGNSITASTVVDQGVTATNSSQSGQGKPAGFLGGFLGGIGHFFSHLFGF